jgi:flagellum-specific ATP synthase
MSGREWPSGGIRAGALDRSPVRATFDVGVRALNALTTFGVGQRIGIMAGSGVGKSVLLDMIAHGAEAEIVIVGLIGERAREVSDFVERHMQGPKRERSIVVAVPADHAPNLRIRGAMLATSMAEYFRKAGRRVLLIMDSLTRVAHAGRESRCCSANRRGARLSPSALATITKLVERAGNSPKAADRSPGSTPCSPMATIRTTRSSTPPDRFWTGTSCCRAIWRSAGNIPRSTSPLRSAA